MNRSPECFVIVRGNAYWTLNNAASHWADLTTKPELALRYADVEMAKEVIKNYPERLAGAKVVRRTQSEEVVA